MTNILLADEINRAMPRTQSSLLEAMEERQVTLENNLRLCRNRSLLLRRKTQLNHKDFPSSRCTARSLLMTISIGYPTPEDELQMMRRFRNDLPLESVTSVISLEDILESQNE